MKPCPCGSGKDSWILNDARGIYVSRVCADCIERIKSGYRPEIFTDSSYWTDEPIEEEDY
jgi:hypothetical protein